MEKPKEHVRTAYVHITKHRVETTREVLKHQIYADFDADGRIVGFEFIDPLDVEINGEIQ